MKHSNYGFNEFVVARGHKGDDIKRYFLDYFSVNSNLRIKLDSGEVAATNGNADGESDRHRCATATGAGSSS